MSNQESTEKTITVKELEEFYWEMCEDWHLWDEQELGKYPITRTLEAMKNFVNSKKS
jgi:hypothetical protein